MADIAENLKRVTSRIEAAAIEAKRDPKSVTLVCVSKTHPSSAIMQAVKKGYRHIGENYLSEALSKQETLADDHIHWHFIGAIQSNKCKTIARKFNWVHSVPSVKVARKLNSYRDAKLGKLNILLQVNVDAEQSKSGFLYHEVIDAMEELIELDQLSLRGFMAIPQKRQHFHQQKQVFGQLEQFRQNMLVRFPDSQLDCLSMGMSGDLEAAIHAGATHVRIGTDIFGKRAAREISADAVAS